MRRARGGAQAACARHEVGARESAPSRSGAVPGSGASSGSTGFLKRHRRAVPAVLGAAMIFGFVYYVAPQIAGLGPTLRRLRAGDTWWLVAGVAFEALSFVGLVVLFRGVFSRPGGRIGWRSSYQITMAGGVAAKLFATAGAGGVALTVWALRASGLAADEVASGMVCYELLNYAVYMAALAVAGFGLWLGVFEGPAPIGVTLIPAIFGTAVIVIVLSMSFAEAPVERYLVRRADRSRGRGEAWWRRAATIPRALRSGLAGALVIVRRRDPAIPGVLAAWGFDIAALWASFKAFGASPPGAVLVMGYYVGTLANTLPLPGGIGGVEGGMIGAFLAFGVSGPLAVLAVLAYRTISYWLPTLPGVIAYVRLRNTIGDWRSRSEGGSPWSRRAEPPGEQGGPRSTEHVRH
jgi:putative heme transporter